MLPQCGFTGCQIFCIHFTAVATASQRVPLHNTQLSVSGKPRRHTDLGTSAVNNRAPPSGCLHRLYLSAEGWYGLKQVSNESIVGNLHSHNLGQCSKRCIAAPSNMLSGMRDEADPCTCLELSWPSCLQILYSSMTSAFSDLKDGRLRIAVDGYNTFRILHARQVLYGARDAHSNVEVWSYNLSCLSDLERQPPI